MNPYIALIRPGNAILTAIAVIAGAFIAKGPEDILDFQTEIAICCVSAMMLVGGGNALNDYNDRESDKKNHPKRPIPSGKISAENALTFAQILLGLGLVILIFTLDNKMPFVIALLGVITLIAYENGLKAAGNVSCPTLCILGDKDKMVPLDKGKKMVEKIKNSKLEVLKECGHMIIFEKAFEMREIVKKFVEKNHKN